MTFMGRYVFTAMFRLFICAQGKRGGWGGGGEGGEGPEARQSSKNVLFVPLRSTLKINISSQGEHILSF